MKSITKILIDIGPLAIFFIFYTRGNLQSAILPFMIATVIAVLFSYVIEKKIPLMPTVGAGIILVFGGLTIYFDNEVFFKMKPTIINLLFAIILYGGEITNKPLLKYLLGATLKLQEQGWSILTKRWIIFSGEIESSLIPSHWHAWLHKTISTPPINYQHKYKWQKDHLPNMTGTSKAYYPNSHLLSDSKKNIIEEYETWKP